MSTIYATLSIPPAITMLTENRRAMGDGVARERRFAVVAAVHRRMAQVFVFAWLVRREMPAKFPEHSGYCPLV